MVYSEFAVLSPAAAPFSSDSCRSSARTLLESRFRSAASSRRSSCTSSSSATVACFCSVSSVSTDFSRRRSAVHFSA